MGEVARTDGAQLIADIVLKGDMRSLTPAQKVEYYNRFCESLGLNPLTQPFKFIKLNDGREALYAMKDATEQLRKINGVSVTGLDAKQIGDVYVVTATGKDKTGRTDTSTGAVTIGNLKGDMLANALMKAETKAKRRLTLSICGLGILDETEIETIPDARTIREVQAEKAIGDLRHGRQEIDKLIERYAPHLAEAVVETTRMDMDAAKDVDELRLVYLSLQQQGRKAELAETRERSKESIKEAASEYVGKSDELSDADVPDDVDMEPDDGADLDAIADKAWDDKEELF